MYPAMKVERISLWGNFQDTYELYADVEQALFYAAY